MDKSTTLVLVGCVKGKQQVAAPAQDLYTSALFRKRKAFAQKFGQRWLILSALHGVIGPEQITAPYDVTLNSMGIKARRAWAEQVDKQLQPYLPGVQRVVLLAGGKYAEFLQGNLERQGIEVMQPLKHVAGVGPQQKWLESAVETGRWEA